MRGWPEDFPTAPHKGRPPAALPQKAPGHSGPGGGRGEQRRGTAYLATPKWGLRPQGRRLPTDHGGFGGPQAWTLGSSLIQSPEPATHPSRWPMVPERKSLWGWGTLPITPTAATMGPPALPTLGHTPRPSLPPAGRFLLPSLAPPTHHQPVLPPQQVTGREHGGAKDWARPPPGPSASSSEM